MRNVSFDFVEVATDFEVPVVYIFFLTFLECFSNFFFCVISTFTPLFPQKCDKNKTKQEGQAMHFSCELKTDIFQMAVNRGLNMVVWQQWSPMWENKMLNPFACILFFGTKIHYAASLSSCILRSQTDEWRFLFSPVMTPLCLCESTTGGDDKK